jgi:hypothetical protein
MKVGNVHTVISKKLYFIKCDKLSRFSLSLPDIHLDLVFINDVLICQTLCTITLILQLPRYHRKPFLGDNYGLIIGHFTKHGIRVK